MRFAFEIVYRKGESMGIADTMSREHSQQNKSEVTTQQAKIIHEAHEKVGHRGLEATLYEIKSKFTQCPRQRAEMQEYLNKCEICLRNKNKTKGGAIFIETSIKLEKLGLDIMESGEEYYLIGIDYFTRKLFGE